MTDTREAFGPALRTQRERHGVTLAEIADSTKIGIGLLNALERSDLSRWPKGVYRRAFFREYAVAIGLSPDEVMSDFVRLFPDEPGATPTAEPPAALRLTLADREGERQFVIARRLAVVAGELAAIGLAGAVGSWFLSVNLWLACGLVALVYYPVTNVFLDRRWRRAQLAREQQQLRGLISSQLPTANSQARGYEEIEVHEELHQGSY